MAINEHLPLGGGFSHLQNSSGSVRQGLLSGNFRVELKQRLWGKACLRLPAHKVPQLTRWLQYLSKDLKEVRKLLRVMPLSGGRAF